MKFPQSLVRISVVLNTLTFGPPDMSLCARFEMHRRNSSFIGAFLVWIADALFFFDPQHCRKSHWLWSNKDKI